MIKATAKPSKSTSPITFTKESITTNAFLMTLFRGCISSYILATFFDCPFPVSLTQTLEHYGEYEIEIFYKDKRSVEELLSDCGVEEFENIQDLLEATLDVIEEIVFSEEYDIEAI